MTREQREVIAETIGAVDTVRSMINSLAQWSNGVLMEHVESLQAMLDVDMEE